MARVSRTGPWREPPTAADAAATLRDLDAIGARSGRAAYANLTRLPLFGWGVAWLAGYVMLGVLPWRIAVPAGIVLALAAVAVTILARSAEVQNGRERRIQLCWVAVMASSPLLVAVASPAPRATLALLLGALWGLASLLYATMTADRALAVVGGLTVVTATVAHVALGPVELVAFGLVAGGAMAALGLARTVGGRR